MRIVCISDTHNCNEQIEIPDGDILVHSGDATVKGTEPEIEEFLAWFSSHPHKTKIFVAGNHDWMYQRDNRRARMLTSSFDIEYLEDSATEIDGIKFYGSPWQPKYFEWAFNLERGEEIAEKWRKIPDDTQILITHGPPKGILDQVPRRNWWEKAGCEELRKRVEALAAERLRLHIFGHIHSGYGQTNDFGVNFVNASTCDEEYEPTQPPIIVDF